MTKYRAVYRDAKRASFSAPVEKLSDGSWVMHTSDGLQLPIDFHFTDDAAGVLTFDSYREEPEPVDLRLHLPEKIGTESSFQQLQRAYVEKEVIAQRQHRQAARASAQQTFINPAKIEAARQINNQYAALKNRHGLKNQ